MGGLVDRFAALLARRFVLNAFLPVLLIGTACSAITLYATGLLPAAAALWDEMDPVSRILGTASLVTLAWFLAGVLASQFRNLTQLYEGYPFGWLPWLRKLSGRLAENHTLRRDAWRRRPEMIDRAFYAYPEGGQEDFLPTALGNALRSAEYYPWYRYGAPAVFAWPRLYQIAPDSYRRDVEEFRTDYEWLLGVSFLCIASAIASGTIQILIGARWWIFASTFFGGCVLSMLAYQAAISAAEEYGAQVRAGFDMYRTDVLVQMRWDVPSDQADEKRIWSEFRRFHLRGEPRITPYPQWPSAKAESTSSEVRSRKDP